mmetsp:Transcript_125961/g.306032  ORF Transcript_125961/g.306032 Transcript_125961/m.306032 type:complete len:562 (-) Transcript_125961:187-1872(-)
MGQTSQRSFAIRNAILLLGGLALAIAGGAVPGQQSEGTEDDFFQSLSDALGRSNASLAGPFSASVDRDLPELWAALEPTLASLSTGTPDRFGSTAVRYALHRLFVRLRGWSLVGLDPEGQAWNATWTSNVTLLAKAPANVRTRIQEHVDGPGLSAKGVALLAVLLQHLAREEVAQQLRDVFIALELPLAGVLNPWVAQRALDAHVASQLVSRSPASMGRAKWLRVVSRVARVYPNWPVLQRSIHDEVERELQVRRADFAGLAEVAGAVGERWGRWGNSECKSLKDELVTVEDRGSGRVRLADFYGKALHEGKWQLRESVEYLRQLGALDETNPHNPRVIIPNYIGAAGNCIASSDIMSVCCISECEDIMNQLEDKLRAPRATAREIAAAVAALPSSTVPAKGDLSAVMRHRLNRIAADNDGMVPLHGRLFAQWLHHAYPRECPYPHLSGRTRQQQMNTFAQTGHNVTATRSQMAALAGKDAQSWTRPGQSRPLENTPWSHEEELFVPLAQQPDAWAVLHTSVFLAALAIGTLGYTLLQLVRSARRAAARAAQVSPSKLCPV